MKGTTREKGNVDSRRDRSRRGLLHPCRRRPGIHSFFFAKAVAQPMIEHGGGAILFTSSISGVSGEEDQVAYSATKGGIIALVTAMAKDLGRYKIRVNCLLPGPVDTQQF